MLFCSIFQRGYSGTPISLYCSADAPLRLIEVYWGLWGSRIVFIRRATGVVFPTPISLATLFLANARWRSHIRKEPARPHSDSRDDQTPDQFERDDTTFVQRPYVRQNNFKKIIETESAAQSHEKKVHTSTQQLIGNRFIAFIDIR